MLGSSLTPQAVASALDVGRDALEHWINEGWLHTHSPLSRHQQIDLAEALRFIRRHHLTIHHPDALGLHQKQAPAPASAQDEEHRLLDAIASPRQDMLLDHLLARYATTENLTAYLDGPVQEALRHCRTALHPAGPSEQARDALHAAAHAIWRIATLIQPEDPGAPAVISASLKDDRDPTPAALAALVLADRGHRVIKPGPQAPASALIRATIESQPRVACLSISQPKRPPAVAGQQVADLCERFAAMGIAVHVIAPAWQGPSLPGLHVGTLEELMRKMDRRSEPGS